jgi:antirestriction protein ArdC
MARSKKHETADEIRKRISDTMIEALKENRVPWRQPWRLHPNYGNPANFASDRRYTGINPIILIWTQMICGYNSRYWGTADSWLKNIGVHVKKGEEATFVILFRMIQKKDKITGKVEKGKDGKDKVIPLMREYPVFHVEQLQAPAVDMLLGVPYPFSIVRKMLGDYTKTKRTTPTTEAELLQIAASYLPANKQPSEELGREKIAQAIHEGIGERLASYRADDVEVDTTPDFEPAEKLMVATGATIKHGGARASYTHKPADLVRLPSKGSFDSKTDYYQTAFHELIHWVVNGGRIEVKEELLKNYAFCELVAEIGACFCLNEVGVPLAANMLPKSQSYVAAWLERMGSDHRFIFEASTVAGKAVDFLLAFIGKQNPVYKTGGEDSDAEEEPNRRSVA